MDQAKDKSCFNCDFCGMDMDMDPYCVAPQVIAESPHGSVVTSARVARLCPSPEKPLFQVRKPRTGT